MGAGTRMPKVQEILKKTIGRQELGKSINTDEAAALGAVYQAAYMTKGFKVLKFGVKDANLFPIQVQFPKAIKVDFERIKVEDGSKNTRMVRRTLFGKMNPFPQKKVMTFNKHLEDFSFSVNYGDLGLSDEEMKTFDSLNLTKVQLKGVGEALKKHSEETESKGVKAHFRMDEGGLLYLDKVESVFEKQADPTSKEEESTLSKLGSTISNFFSGKADEDKEGDVKSEDVKEKEKVDPSDTKENTSKPKKDNKEKKAKTDSAKEKPKKETKKEETKKEKQKDKKNGEKKDNKTENSNNTKSNKTEEKIPPKPVRISEDIENEIECLDIKEPLLDTIKMYRKRISDMKKVDEEKHALQKIKNELETFIFDAKDKQTQEIYEQTATEEERNKFSQKLTEAADWLEYEADDSTTKDTYKDKLKSLKKECKEWFDRVKEHNERPHALDTLKEMLNFTDHFYKGMENYTGEDKPFTKVEQETLSKLLNDTKDWRNQMVKDQKKNPLYNKPKFTIMDIATKLQALDREVKYLVNKAKTFVPKPKPKVEIKESNKTKKASNDTTVDDESISSNETKTADESSETAKAKTTADSSEKEAPTEKPIESQEEAPSTNKKDKSKEDATDTIEETLELPPSADETGGNTKTSASKEENTDGKEQKDNNDAEKHKEL